ncbi:MAG TPA: CHAT domain-containing protein, partial [Pyrinomonadaceae bacterium]
PQIQNEAQLVAALCRASSDKQAIDTLLRSHAQFVNSQLGSNLNDAAAAAYYGPTPERSIAIYQIAIEIGSRLQDYRLIGMTYYNLGRTYSGFNQFSKAIEAYQHSKEAFEKAGRQRDLIYVLADMGAFYFILEDYQKARNYSEQSIALAGKLKRENQPAGAWPDDFGRARAVQTLGEIALREGSHTYALEKLQEAVALYERLSGTTRTYDYYLASVYEALGRLYPELGDSRRALLYFNQALEIARKQSDQGLIAGLHNDIGYLYLDQEDYDQARAQFNESLRIYVSLKNQREEARELQNLGVVEQRNSNFKEALQYFRLSLQAAQATDSIEVQIADYEGMGVVLTAKRDFIPAKESLNRGLLIAKEANDNIRQTEILWRLAQTEYDSKSFAQSAAIAETALNLARSSHLPKLTYLATTTLGQSYAAQNKLELARQMLKQSIEQLEILRQQVAGREIETGLFLENQIAPYQALIDVLVQEGKIFEALVYAERAKGRVLLDVLKEGKTDLERVLTAAQRDERSRLNRRISEVNDQITSAKNSGASSLKSFYEQLDSARLEYQSFQDSLYALHSDLGVRAGRIPSLAINDLDQLSRDNNCAYLEYVVGKEHVAVFVVTPNPGGHANLKVYQFAVNSEELADKVNQFHDLLASRRPDYASAARGLYNLLVEPITQQLRGITTLCIIPDGCLWNLPFQALMSKRDHFLIEDRPLYFATSLSVLKELGKRKKGSDNPQTSLVAFANPSLSKTEQQSNDLSPLPESQNEVTAVAKTFSRAASRVVIGSEATESAFKAIAPDYSVIHLATHGVLDNRQPLYSHLVLARNESDSENDGLLEAREIMDLRLQAQLAVLSACETANGKISPGEGVISIAWAFMVAGCRSLLVSQWSVNSESTSQLMANFYKLLRFDPYYSTVTKSMALRSAVLELMKEQRSHHPFYWAGFVLVGNN